MAEAGMAGYAPTVKVEPYNPEAAKYKVLWERPEYRVSSPGEQWAMTFLSQARVEKDAEVIDFGCGTGRGGMFLAALGGMRATLVDFVDNCLDPEVAQACQTQPERMRFIKADLTQPMTVNAAYGYCCDVMEHIPPEDVRKVLANILGSAQHCFFAISTVDDVMGALIGEPLHLTVQSASWWAEQLTSLGAVIHWHQESENACAFYCSAWHEAREVIKTGRINTDEAVVEAQTQANIRANWPQAQPHARQNREIVLLCGGPSMADCLDTIRELRAEGAGIVTVNGAYKWALEQELKVGMQIVLDAREFNARFVQPQTDYTKYLIASQAHPATYEGLPRDRTLQWHSGISEESEALVRELHTHYFPIPGGSTVVLRAIPLLRMLGYWRIHLFGFDSCVRSDAHHAYAQPENDGEPTVPVTCAGKTYNCTPWQVSQASEFRDIVNLLGDEVELAVYGDGLIAAMICAGADFHTQEQ